jgi:VIT1/CCC1 family predicted Fe2+/Mn2+ transporter
MKATMLYAAGDIRCEEVAEPKILKDTDVMAFAVLAAVFLLVGLFAFGTAVFAAIVLPIISVVAALGIVACLVAFLPMAAFRKTRPISAIGLYALS